MIQGLYGQGKSGEKGRFCFGQGKSGENGRFCFGQGKSGEKGRFCFGQGKSGEKGRFCFGQGKSGKLPVVRGKIAFSFCRSGKYFIFHHQRNVYNTLINR